MPSRESGGAAGEAGHGRHFIRGAGELIRRLRKTAAMRAVRARSKRRGRVLLARSRIGAVFPGPGSSIFFRVTCRMFSLLVGLLALSFPRSQEPRLLTPPLAPTHRVEVTDPTLELAPSRVVFREGTLLRSAPLDGTSSSVLVGSGQGPFKPLPGSGRFLGLAVDHDALNLFAWPLAGGASPIRLSALSSDARVNHDFEALPDGSRVLFLSGIHDGPFELHSVPATGGLTLRPFPIGWLTKAFRIVRDGTRAVCLAAPPRGTFELYRVTTASVTTPRLLNDPLVPGGRIESDFELAPASSWLVYRASQESLERTELWLATVSPLGPTRRLSAATLPEGDVRRFRIAPDGLTVVYTGEQETAGARELFAAPLDQVAPPVRLGPALLRGGTVFDDFQFDPAGTRVVFRVAPGDQVSALYSVPLAGGAPVVLAGPVRGRTSIAEDVRIAADGTRVVFRADLDQDRVFELWSVPIDGGTPTRLDPPGADVTAFVSHGDRVLFRAELATPGVPELFVVPIDASQPPRRIHPALAFGRATLPAFQISADGAWAVYQADPVERGVFELFTVPLVGGDPVGLDGSNVYQPSSPRLVDFERAGGRVLYRATQELGDVLGLYSVPVEGGEPPVALSPLPASAGEVLTRRVTPDGRRVVFVQGSAHGRRELYSAPVDGHAPATRLDVPQHARADVEPRFVLSEDGREVLFVADLEEDERAELYRVPVAGGVAPTRLHPALRSGRSVKATFACGADRVAYASDARVARRFELYVAPLDGGAPPLQLQRKANGGGDVRAITLTPDGRAAVYLADQEVDERFELHVVPLDGSGAPRRLNAPLVPGGDVQAFAVDPKGHRALYLADQDLDGARELYTVPLDGSAPPLKLNPPAIALSNSRGDVPWFTLAPDGEHVVFLAGIYGPSFVSLYAAPLDGGAPATLLDPFHAGSPTTWVVRIAADSSRVVYFLRSRTAVENFGLFSVPLDGSTPPVLLNVPGVATATFALDPGDATVTYALRRLGASQPSLYSVPIEGPRTASVELFSARQGIRQLDSRADGLVYLDLDGVRSSVAPGRRRSAAPPR